MFYFFIFILVALLVTLTKAWQKNCDREDLFDYCFECNFYMVGSSRLVWTIFNCITRKLRLLIQRVEWNLGQRYEDQGLLSNTVFLQLGPKVQIFHSFLKQLHQVRTESMMLMGIYQTMKWNHQFSLDYCYFSMICLGDKDPSIIIYHIWIV